MKRKNVRFLIVGIVVALAVGYLVYGATKHAGVYYLTVSELMGKQELMNKYVRVSGKVVDGSIKWYLKDLAPAKEIIYEFSIQDGKNILKVSYAGSLPDAFKPGTEVVIEGVYENGEIFKAEKLMAKCPSRYEAE